MSGGGKPDTSGINRMAKAQEEVFSSTGVPALQQYYTALQDLNTNAAYDRAAGDAAAQTAQAFDAQRASLQAMRESRGLSSTLSSLDDLKLSIGEATAKALAANRARSTQLNQYLAGMDRVSSVALGQGAAASQSYGQAAQIDGSYTNAENAALGQLIGMGATAGTMYAGRK